MIIVIVLIIVAILLVVIGNILYKITFSNEVSKDFILDAKCNTNSIALHEEKLDVEGKEVIEVSIKSFDKLKLFGKVIKVKNKINPRAKNNKWCILVHGYTDTHENMAIQANKFINEGLNVLLIDLRAHGNSEGKYIGFGWNDRKDILLWANYLLKEYGNVSICLYGISMGAATVMMSAGEDLPKNVKCLIADSGYTSVYDQLKYQCKTIYKFCPKILMEFFTIVVKIKGKYSIKEASSVKQLSKSNLPILFIQSDNDTFVPSSMLDELYEIANDKKERLIVPGGEHVRSHIKEPEIYWSNVFNFIGKYM